MKRGIQSTQTIKLSFFDKLISFSFSNFEKIGFYLYKIFKPVGEKMELAQIKIYPPAYFSFSFFVCLVLFLVLLAFSTILNLEIYHVLNFPFFHLIFNFLGKPVSTYQFVVVFRDNPILNLLFLKLFFIFPLLLFVIFLVIPDIRLSMWTEGLETETPFIGTFVSVMATGGISPYHAIKAFATNKILPTFSLIAQRIITLVSVFGKDPLTAIEETSRYIPSRDLKELLTGYVTSVRTGGDFVHFLFVKTETLFRDRIVKMRQIGEKMGMLMEVFIALTILLSLGLYAIYIVNTALPETSTPFMSGTSFFVFAFLFTPFLSMVFIYLIDLFVPKYPHPDWSILKVGIISFIISSIIFFTFFIVPALNPLLLSIPFIGKINSMFDKFIFSLGFSSGARTPLILAFWIILGSVPPAILEIKRSREERDVEDNLALFLRDLVEARKAGLSPEKCIIQLKDRDYGFFSKRLKVIANQLSWGVPLREIYRYFASTTRTWLSKMLVFLLVEAIDYGGGSVKTLESLAMYSEMMKSVQKEKEGNLKPLLIVVYLGTLILVVAVILLLSFVNVSLKIAGSGVAYESFLSKFVSPIIINVALSGLIAGKISSGSVSTGFKHIVALTTITVLALWLTPMISSILAASSIPH